MADGTTMHGHAGHTTGGGHTMDHSHAAHQMLWSQVKAQFTDADGNVVIPHGVTVLLDESAEIAGTLAVQGKLLVADERDITLRADNVVVVGELKAGTADQPHMHDFDIILTGVEGDPDVVMADWMGMDHGGHDGHMGMGSDMHMHHNEPINNKALLVAPGGSLSLFGAQKESWTQLDGSIEAGATEIKVLDASGWQIGDTLAIAPTGFDPHEVEERTITAIDGNTVTLDQAVEFDHFGAVQELGGGKVLDMRGEVANLSRSITISGSEEGERTTEYDDRGNAFEVGYGGHTMFHEGGLIQISSVEFAGLGITGDKGNYPIHFHMAGDMSGSFIEDSAIHHTLQRGMIVHQTDNLLIKDNVIFDTVGHQYYLEDGNEQGNQFVGNLGMLPRRTPDELQIENLGKLESNVGERPSVFWITNAANDFIDNHAVGFEHGQGFWYRMADGPDEGEVVPFRVRGYEHPEVGLNIGNVAHTGQLPETAYLVSYGPAWTTVGMDIQSTPARGEVVVEDGQFWNIENIGISLGRETDAVIDTVTAGVGRHYRLSPGKGGEDRVVEIENPSILGETDNPATINVRSLLEDAIPGNQQAAVVFDNATSSTLKITGGEILGAEGLASVHGYNHYTPNVGIRTQFEPGADGVAIDPYDYPNFLQVSGPDVVLAGGGNDEIKGNKTGGQVLVGQEGDDRIETGGGGDIAIGGAGNDTFRGWSDKAGNNDDVFMGGTGDDYFELDRNKSDQDAFIFRKGDGHDIIQSGRFDGARDKVVLIGYSEEELAAAQVGGGLYDFGNGDILELGRKNTGLDAFELLASADEAEGRIAEALALDGLPDYARPPSEDVNPAPTSPPEDEPAVPAGPVDVPAALANYGVGEVNGRSDAVIVEHDAAWERSSGAITLSFTAEDVGGRQGLLSKDAKGFDDGGHLTILLEKGEIRARLQSEDQTYDLRGGDITEGVAHHVAVNFGDGGFSLFVDGAQVASSDYTGGLTGNTEDLVLGANQWGSRADTTNKLTHDFNGTIDDVSLFEAPLSADQVASLADGTATTSVSTDGALIDQLAMDPLTEMHGAEGHTDSQMVDTDSYLPVLDTYALSQPVTELVDLL